MRKTYTLTELAVCAAMLLALSALLLPAIQAAAPQAKTALCADNLRKIGAYIQIYAKDNQGYLPASACHQAGTDASYDSAPGRLFRTVISPDKKPYDRTPPNELTALYRCPEDKSPVKRNQSGYVWWYVSKRCRHLKSPDFLREMNTGDQAKRVIVTDFCKLEGLLPKPNYSHADNTINVLYADGTVRTCTQEDLEGVKGWEHLVNFDDLYPEKEEN